MSTRAEAFIITGGGSGGHVTGTAACRLFCSTRAGWFLCLPPTKFQGLDFGSCHEDQEHPAPSGYLAVQVLAWVVSPPPPAFTSHLLRCVWDAPRIAVLIVRKQRKGFLLCSANQKVPPKMESWRILRQAKAPGMEFESKPVGLTASSTLEASREFSQNAVAQASASNSLMRTGLWWSPAI